MKLLKIFLLVAFFVVLGLFVSVAMNTINPTTDVSANPNQCPPGQRDNCTWVQHRVTFKCQYLPDNAVADPWQPVPENTCPQPAEKAQPTNILTAWPPPVLNTPVQPTSIAATLTACPTATSVSNTTNNQQKPDPVADPASDQMPVPIVCDICAAEKQKADALSTLAANDTIRLNNGR